MRGRARICVVCVLAAFGIGAAEASAAVLSVGKYDYVVTNKPVPANGQASKTAKCPKKRTVLGGGAYTSGSGLDDEVAASAPMDGQDSDHRPDDGWVAKINAGVSGADMQAWAICAPLDNVHYKSKTGTAQSMQQKATSAKCSDPDRTLSGGVWTAGHSTGVALAATKNFYTSASNHGWLGAVNNLSGKKQKVTVWAICGKPGNKVSALETTAPGGVGQTSRDAPCVQTPDHPRHLIGGGGSIDGGLQAEIATILPFDDGSDADSAPDDGVTLWTNNGTGVPQGTKVENVCVA